MIEDIYGRAKLLSKTCLKISLVLPVEITMCNLMRGHLIERATDMAIKSKGLVVTQNPDYFLKKLSEAKESCDGCGYWLELIKDEKYLDSDIINPILDECNSISHLFAMAIRKIKPNNY